MKAMLPKSLRRLVAGITAAVVALTLLGVPGGAVAADGPGCRTVRLADIGWTDVTATTAMFSALVRDLGYDPVTTVLSVPVTYASLKNRDIDIFLGNWMPSMETDRHNYVAEGSVEVIRPNLTGARYTLAVPAYTWAQGLKDFDDIRRFAPQLDHAIYGIEPGNDGNRLVLGMLKQEQFGLRDFRLVESSEQGMLAEVERATKAHAPIVFLAWDPHPMNMRFDLRYLTGGDAVFGPNFGGAAVYTNTRAGYSAQCPNIGRLLRNLQFTTHGESEVMADILDRHATPEAAARAWLRTHRDTVRQWLTGVTTLDGRPASTAIAGAREAAGGTFAGFISGHKIPVGDWVATLIEYIKAHGRGLFDAISAIGGGSVNGLTALLAAVPGPLLILLLVALTWLLRRSWPTCLFVAAALLFIMNQGYWTETLQTLALVIVSVAMCTVIGVPIGIAAAHRPRLAAALHPVLDLMQTLPTFVYLIPTLVLFGLGVVPGLISTIIFALPAPIRLTQLGIAAVPEPLREAGAAFGATPLQMLLKIELPCAAATIITGISQCIMLSLSMVVIAALVGAGGLGVPVVRALNTVQIGMGFEAGFVIVLLAIILDRMTHSSASREPRT